MLSRTLTAAPLLATAARARAAPMLARAVAMPLVAPRLAVAVATPAARRAYPAAGAGAVRAFSAKIIDGKAIAQDVRNEVKVQADMFFEKLGRKPGLAVVLVGERPDSAKYVEMKKKAAVECGFESLETVLGEDVSQERLMSVVNELNANPKVDGILVQLPLPEHIDQKAVLQAIDVLKDVDGFHPYNIGGLARKGEELRQENLQFETNEAGNAPCTPLGCIELLDRTGVELSGKHVVVLGRSNIVGLPAAIMAIHRNATVTIVHSRTANTPELCRSADVLIAAIGRAEMVQGDWIKPGATVIDVGVNFKDDPSRKSGRRMCGDVDFAAAKEVAGAITPVPGGVGPMTVAMLMRNTITQAFERARQTVGFSP